MLELVFVHRSSIWENTKLPHKAAISFHIATISLQKFPFLYILTKKYAVYGGFAMNAPICPQIWILGH